MALKNEVDYCSRSPNEEAAFEFFRIEYSAVIMYCFIFLICWKSRVVRLKKKKKKTFVAGVDRNSLLFKQRK